MGLLRSPATLKCKLIYITIVIDEWQIKKVKVKVYTIGILTVTSPIVINVPTRGLLAVETKDSFVLFTCL